MWLHFRGGFQAKLWRRGEDLIVFLHLFDDIVCFYWFDLSTTLLWSNPTARFGFCVCVRGLEGERLDCCLIALLSNRRSIPPPSVLRALALLVAIERDGDLFGSLCIIRDLVVRQAGRQHRSVRRERIDGAKKERTNHREKMKEMNK